MYFNSQRGGAQDRQNLHGVSRSNPCPVCGGTHKCSVGEDGLILCGRVHRAVPGFRFFGPARDPQWCMHRPEGDPALRERQPRPARKREAPAPGDWPARAQEYATNLIPALGDELDEHLGLPRGSWRAVPLVGFEHDRDGGCWTFPECDGHGNVIGLLRRGKRDGIKRSMLGSSRGLTLPIGWREGDGPLFVVEGPSDVLAMAAAGLAAVGRPSNTGGVGHLADLLAGLPDGREIIVVGENDRKPDDRWPGLEGATSVASQLQCRLDRPVSWALPPGGGKDARAWLCGRPEPDWHQRGQMFAAALRDAARPAEVARPGASAAADAGEPEPWEPPVPLGGEGERPAFPLDCLPGWLSEWVGAVAENLQVPADLPGMLALAGSAAAVAGKFRVVVRPGWSEPLNVFATVALQPGERKSATLKEALAPVREHQRRERERLRPAIAEAQARRRALEGRQKHLESQAAKKDDPAERDGLIRDAGRVAEELAGLRVPPVPLLVVDDVTPEYLAKVLDEQGGKMFQAAAEGTAFEIAKGRYSDSSNFDVYLKGHAGDLLDSGRVSRGRTECEEPALTCALAVQPDVLAGLHEESTMRRRGFLARWMYSLPASRVGSREVAPPPVSAEVAGRYRENCLALWELPAAAGPDGKPEAYPLAFDREADDLMQDFERWVEARLGPGGSLSYLSGWGEKLCGLAARLAGVLHLAGEAGMDVTGTVPAKTVRRAIRLARDYLLPHAEAAFGLMGADPRLPQARQVLGWLANELGRRPSEDGEDSECAGQAPRVSRRDVHQGLRRAFDRPEDLDPVLGLLARHGWLRPTGEGRPGRGHRSPVYEVHPDVLRLGGGDCGAHCTHRPQPTSQPGSSEDSEDSECAGEGSGDWQEGVL